MANGSDRAEGEYAPEKKQHNVQQKKYFRHSIHALSHVQIRQSNALKCVRGQQCSYHLSSCLSLFSSFFLNLQQQAEATAVVVKEKKH